MNKKLISEIQKYGKTVKGKKELLKHLDGGHLTPKKAIQAKCYDCMGFFADGRQACKMPKCACYPFMAYNADKKKRKATPVQ